MTTPISNVCSLEADALKKRAAQWTSLKARALRKATESESGATFEYTRSADVEAELEALVEAERACCAVGSVDWSLEKSPEALTVRVTTSAALRESPEAKLIFSALGGPK